MTENGPRGLNLTLYKSIIFQSREVISGPLDFKLRLYEADACTRTFCRKFEVIKVEVMCGGRQEVIFYKPQFRPFRPRFLMENTRQKRFPRQGPIKNTRTHCLGVGQRRDSLARAYK
jgi:hypothetical protein